jgi:ankyrin repeat protein
MSIFNRPETKLSDFEVKDEHGNTPLFYAVASKSFSTVVTLLKIGVNVNAKNQHGNTALHRAMMCDYDPDGTNEAIVDLLLNNACYMPEVVQAISTIASNCRLLTSLNASNDTEIR